MLNSLNHEFKCEEIVNGISEILEDAMKRLSQESHFLNIKKVARYLVQIMSLNTKNPKTPRKIF